MDSIKIIFDDNSIINNVNLRNYLLNHHIGKEKIKNINYNKEILINNNYVDIDKYILKKGDEIELLINENIDFEIEEKEVEIVYEDDYLLVVNKPNGIIIHPEKKSDVGTLVNRIAYYYKKKNINRKIRYLHRIDKDTSGLVMFAKDYYTEGIMIKKIQDGEVDRFYLGIVNGKLEKKKGEIIASIGSDRHVNNKMVISKGSSAKYAKTGYEVIQENDKYSLALFKLFTGRTHQIRVHSAYINHPIVGDEIYGRRSEDYSHLMLHSYEMRFKHPINNEEIIIKKINEDFKIE